MVSNAIGRMPNPNVNRRASLNAAISAGVNVCGSRSRTDRAQRRPEAEPGVAFAEHTSAAPRYLYARTR
jgi:hypothetical protein